jgi:hypothetical protein
MKLCRLSTTDSGKQKSCKDCSSLKTMEKLLNRKTTTKDKSRKKIDWKGVVNG